MPEKVYSNIDIVSEEDALGDLRLSIYNQYKNNFLSDGKTFTFLPYQFYDLISQVLDFDSNAQITEKTIKELYDIFDKYFFADILKYIKNIVTFKDFEYAQGIGVTKVLKFGLDVNKTLSLEQKSKSEKEEFEITDRLVVILDELENLIKNIKQNTLEEPKKPEIDEAKKSVVLKLRMATAKLNQMITDISSFKEVIEFNKFGQVYNDFISNSSIFLNEVGKYYKLDASKIIGSGFIINEPLIESIPPLEELLPIYEKLNQIKDPFQKNINDIISIFVGFESQYGTKTSYKDSFINVRKELFEASNKINIFFIKTLIQIIKDALKKQSEYPKLLEDYQKTKSEFTSLLPLLESKRDFIKENFTELPFFDYKEEDKFSLDYYTFPPNLSVLLEQNKKTYSYKPNKIKVLIQFDIPKTIPYIKIEDPKQNTPNQDGYKKSVQQAYLDSIIQPKKIYVYRTKNEVIDLKKDLYNSQSLYKVLDITNGETSYYEDLEDNTDYYYFYLAQIEEPDNSQLSIIQNRYIINMYPADNNKFYYVMGSYINKIRLVKDEQFYYIYRQTLTQEDLIKKEYGRKFREKFLIKPTEEIFALVSTTAFDVNYPYLKMRITSKKTRKKVDFNLRYGVNKDVKFIPFQDKKKYDIVPLESFTGKIKTLITPIKTITPQELEKITKDIISKTTSLKCKRGKDPVLLVKQDDGTLDRSWTESSEKGVFTKFICQDDGSTPQPAETIIEIIQEETAIGQNLEQIQAGDVGVINQAQQTISNTAIGGVEAALDSNLKSAEDIKTEKGLLENLVAKKDVVGLIAYFIALGNDQDQAILLAQLALSPNTNELFTI